jgi:ABC-type glycerol-3-phosphate transport system substrate-binding protein
MKRLIPTLAVLGAAVALAGCGGDDETSPPTTPTTTTETTDTTPTTDTTTTTPTTTEEEPSGPIVVRVVVVNAAPKGGIVRETVKKGDRVVLTVRSDVADEVHLHGYDISRDVAAGGTVRIRFRAKVPGRFEVELEQRKVQIAELTVKP